MLDFIKSWSINIVMLVLFIVIIEMLLPRGRMKKYVNLLTGTILIIAIIEPVIGLFGRSFDFTAVQTSTAGSISKKEIEKAGRLLEEEQLRQTVELYRRRIIEQIEQSAMEVEGVNAAEADVIINEDQDSEYFGEIKRIYINAVVEGKGNVGSNGKSSIKVEKVESIKTDKAAGGSSDSTVYDSGLNRRLTDRIGGIFGVDRENIIIKQMQR